MPKPKKSKMGRPPIHDGPTTQVTVKYPKRWDAAIAALGKQLMREAGEPKPKPNRAYAIRHLLKQALSLDD